MIFRLCTKGVFVPKDEAKHPDPADIDTAAGYSSEALSFVSYLKDVVQVGIVQHGDSVNEVRFCRTAVQTDGQMDRWAPTHRH